MHRQGLPWPFVRTIVRFLLNLHRIRTYPLLSQTCVVAEARKGFIPIVRGHLALKRQNVKVLEHPHGAKGRWIGKSRRIELSA